MLAETAVQTAYTPFFIASTQAVFKTMLGWEVEVIATDRVDEFQPGHDVAGIIGFAGCIEGTIVISLDKDVVFAAADIFIGERPTTINSDILDLVGELANMIGGGAKERINLSGIALGLPTTVSGSDYRISFKPDVAIETIRFQSPNGPLTVQIAMRRI